MGDIMTDAQKEMHNMLKGLKPQTGHDLPAVQSQPPRTPHPDLNPDGSLKK